MLTKKIPLYFTIVIVFIASAISYLAFYFINRQELDAIANGTNGNDYCNYNIARLSGYQYIRPLLFAEPSCEAASLYGIKTDLESEINSLKNKGIITTASVYLREFHKGEWMSINENEKFSPGSLLKVPELITFFKMNEKQPGILEKKITFDHPLISDKTATYLSKSIQLGKTYTIMELLEYMISYSDNNATLLLNQQIDVPTFKKVFTDMGLAEPDFNAKEYPITAKDYSLFMKGLFNASYLSIKDSERCTEMLGTSDFRDGMMAGIPSTCKIAHKFGEGGYSNAPNFSESGIIYCNDKPYVLTIMTKGADMKKLPGVIKEISQMVYSRMSTLQ